MVWQDYIRKCIENDSDKNTLSKNEKQIIVTFLLDCARSEKKDEV
jgi:hypothetical protein